MLTSLLAENTGGSSTWIMLAIVAVLIVVIGVFYFLSNKKRKKQEQDAKDLINAVKPGNKVKTIGGICGIVVEVDDEENTFVLETGTEASGKSYVKFDRQAIYQTDAVVEKKEDKPAEAKTDSAPADENTTAETMPAPENTEVAELAVPVPEVLPETDKKDEPKSEEALASTEPKEEAKPAPKPGKKSKKVEEEKQVKF